MANNRLFTDTMHRLGVRLIRLVFPKAWRKPMISKMQAWYFRGTAVSCPCCEGQFSRFLPFGVHIRENAQCPQCFCLERHRSIWLYLKQQAPLFTDNLKVLHFAPETIYQQLFSKQSNLEYITADIEAGRAMRQVDVMNIESPGNEFDVVLCNHVLEHVTDDRKAMSEIYRVLKPGGWAILDVPLEPSLEVTREDPTVTNPKEREKLFGQSDHVRLYGQDYKHRLSEAGFSVNIIRITDTLSMETKQQYGLVDHDIYVCAKPIAQKDVHTDEKHTVFS